MDIENPARENWVQVGLLLFKQPMNDKRLRQAKMHILANFMSISLTQKKPIIFTAKNLHSCSTPEPCQYCKSGSTSSSREQAAASSECRQAGNALCLSLPVQSGPQESPRARFYLLQSHTETVPSLNFF